MCSAGPLAEPTLPRLRVHARVPIQPVHLLRLVRPFVDQADLRGPAIPLDVSGVVAAEDHPVLPGAAFPRPAANRLFH